jgi:hypothetical protein
MIEESWTPYPFRVFALAARVGYLETQSASLVRSLYVD